MSKYNPHLPAFNLWHSSRRLLIGLGWWSKYACCFVCAVPACHGPCFCRLASTPAFFPVPPPSTTVLELRLGGRGVMVGVVVIVADAL